MVPKCSQGQGKGFQELTTFFEVWKLSALGVSIKAWTSNKLFDSNVPRTSISSRDDRSTSITWRVAIPSSDRPMCLALEPPLTCRSHCRRSPLQQMLRLSSGSGSEAGAWRTYSLVRLGAVLGASICPDLRRPVAFGAAPEWSVLGSRCRVSESFWRSPPPSTFSL